MCVVTPTRIPRPIETLTEREFQSAVIELARMFKWRLAHFRPGKDRRGKWSTPMSGDVGFPDLVLVGYGRVIFAELKAQDGAVRPEQREWLADLLLAGAETYLWRPSDLDEIALVLGPTYRPPAAIDRPDPLRR